LFNQLAQHLDAEQPVYALRARGLDGKTPPHATIEAMASAYIREIKTVQPQAPYYLTGFSLGGKIAYEMACQLQEAGEEIALLTALDTITKDGGDILEQVDPYLEDQPEEKDGAIPRWNRHSEALRALPLAEKALYMVKMVGRVTAVQTQRLINTRNPAMGNLAWSPYRRLRHFVRKAEKAYIPRPFSGKMVLIVTETSLNEFGDPADYWRRHVQGEVETVLIPGSHESIHYEPHVHILSEKLRELLDQAQMQSA
jgi:thioesterase domain-containing protein